MASSSNGSWETDLRDAVRTNFGKDGLSMAKEKARLKSSMFTMKGLARPIRELQ